MPDTFALRFSCRMSGAAGYVKRDGKILEFTERADADAYAREHSTQTRSVWVEDPEQD